MPSSVMEGRLKCHCDICSAEENHTCHTDGICFAVTRKVKSGALLHEYRWALCVAGPLDGGRPGALGAWPKPGEVPVRSRRSLSWPEWACRPRLERTLCSAPSAGCALGSAREASGRDGGPVGGPSWELSTRVSCA
ncbi:unnamed protein product [Ixodes pacificus]